MEGNKIRSEMTMVKLWAHELNRVFRDRLISEFDLMNYDAMVKIICTSFAISIDICQSNSDDNDNLEKEKMKEEEKSIKTKSINIDKNIRKDASVVNNNDKNNKIQIKPSYIVSEEDLQQII